MKHIVQRNSLSASCSNSQITSLQTFDQYLGPFLVKDICIINSLTFQVILIQLGHFWMPHPPFICSIDGVCHHCIKNVLFLLKANELNEKALPSLSRNYWNTTLQKVLNNIPNVFESNYTSIYRMRAIITRGLYTFNPLFEVHLCTVTFGLMYG